MKKVIIFFALIGIFSSVNSTTNLIPSSVATRLKANEVYLPVGKTGHLISLMDLSRISVKDFETLSGKKMKFYEKMNFKLGQHQLKKSINEDGTFNKKSIEKYLTRPIAGGGGFSLVGLLLGLFLSLIGVLIAYLIGSDNKSRISGPGSGQLFPLSSGAQSLSDYFSQLICYAAWIIVMRTYSAPCLTECARKLIDPKVLFAINICDK